MQDIFVIAEEEVILAFQLVGVGGRSASGREEALDAFFFATGTGEDRSGRRYPGIGARILLLTEEVSDLIADEAREWQLVGEYPLIVEIPGPRGRPAGRKGLVDAIREAVGIRV